MGLLKSIKYSLFEGTALNGIVDKISSDGHKNEHFRL